MMALRPFARQEFTELQATTQVSRKSSRDTSETGRPETRAGTAGLQAACFDGTRLDRTALKDIGGGSCCIQPKSQVLAFVMTHRSQA
jgi:hypothetical protein